ncbi:MAG TPA: hypothetical protein VFA48_01915 [Gammaproteobacteria bacterium]|nr:hypothetical protein [Gammaproteobacteria bacterium]
MAYGKNKGRKKWLIRAVPLGVGKLSGTKRDTLFGLRDAVLTLMREMAEACFVSEPLAEAFDSQALDAKLIAIQKAASGNLNSVWREQARMRVKPALEECNRRYFRRLAGSLRFVDEPIAQAQRTAKSSRRYFHIPETIQDAVASADINALKAVAESGDALALFRRVILDGDTSDLTANQLAILRDIHARAQRKHTCPQFGAGDEFVLQLHVDARMLASGHKAEPGELMKGVAFVLEDDTNRRFHRFLDLAGVKPRGARVRIPLVLTQRIAKRLSSAKRDWAALIVELSERQIGVRLVGGKPPPVWQAGATLHRMVGRDFGYTNTVTLSVVESTTPVDPSAVDIPERGKTEADKKAAARQFFETHAAPPDVDVLERWRFEGRPFLHRVAELAARIDAYKSRIDQAYNDLGRLKATIVNGLGLQPGQRITAAMKRSLLGKEVREFFHLYAQIRDLKAARRALYHKIKAVTKHWFGFLSNVEVELARTHDAALVCENLTVMAIEKDELGYKGRAFNKMLNNGSKGQYLRRAAGKLQWNGVPEVAVPSWYTSRACTVHSVVVKAACRRGERIFLPCCGRKDHADEHAADTLGIMPFLRPRFVPGSGSELVTPAIP